MVDGRRTAKRTVIAVSTIVATAAILGLTTTRPPSPALADEIDRALERDPCVGSVERWPARYYGWKPTSWFRANDGRKVFWMLSGPWLGSDTSKVNVRLYQGASESIYPRGRHLLRADQDELRLDSSNFLFAAGTYDLRTRKLTDWTCGPSSG